MPKDNIDLHPYAAAVVHYLLGVAVEINCGDVKTTLNFDDAEIAQMSLIRGVVKDAFGDCIIVECDLEGVKNLVFVNCWSIKTMIPLNSTLSTKDIFCDEEFSRTYRRRPNKRGNL
jgi:hypothetical protein